MDYSCLDREEYMDVPIFMIEQNRNDLLFFIMEMDRCSREKHRHSYVQIIYILKGRLKHVLNNNEFDVRKGDIFIIPPFVPHYFIDCYNEKYELIEFEFSPEFINERFSIGESDSSFFDFAYLEPFLVSENKVKPCLNLTGNLRLEAESIFYEVLREYKNRENDFELIIKALLLKLLVIVGREFKREIQGTESTGLYKRHKEALENSLSFINNHFTEHVTIEKAAKAALFSKSYFRYLFRQMTGMTFIEYINKLRILKALELLKNCREKKIIEISSEVGYNNVNHFNRIFKLETGLTPRQVKGKADAVSAVTATDAQ